MGESAEHIFLVRIIYNYVNNIITNIHKNLVRVDIPNCPNKPNNNIEGFRPDYEYQWEKTLIIGEAKTNPDIERKHSLDQYNSYLKQCNNFDGNSIFILCVPWDCEPTANNLIKRLIKKSNYNNVRVIIISNIHEGKAIICKK